MRQVILDTNFLMIPYRFRIDIFSEIERLLEEPYELVLSSRAIKELAIIEKRMDVSKRGARLGRAMLEQKIKEGKVSVIENDDRVDDWIVKYASENKSIVCTNDMLLRKRLREKKVKLISLRGKSHLCVV